MYRYLTIIFIQFSFISYAQVAKFGNDFLRIGNNAAVISYAGAKITSFDDASDAYLNPALLANMKKKLSLGYTHLTYNDNLASYDFLSIAYKASDSLFVAASILRLSIDDIMNTINLADNQGNFNYNNISYFSVADYALVGSIAKKIHRSAIVIGSNIKIIYRNQGNFAKAYGFGIDVAAYLPIKKWNFAVIVKDATTTFSYWTYQYNMLTSTTNDSLFASDLKNSELILPSLQLAGSRRFSLSSQLDMRFELLLNSFFDGQKHMLINSRYFNISPAFGIDLRFRNVLSARWGIADLFFSKSNFDGKNTAQYKMSFGLGIVLKNIGFDYAFRMLTNDKQFFQHVFSAHYSF